MLFCPRCAVNLVMLFGLWFQYCISLSFTTNQLTKAQITIRSSRDQDLLSAASFLSSSMYIPASTSITSPGSSSSIPKGQLKELTNLEFVDLRKRYSRSSQASLLKFPYSLLLAQEGADSNIVGTLGLDCQILDKKHNKFKKITSSSLSFIDADYEEPVVVLSNLAVRPDKRKLGIARMLLQESESLVLEWGYDNIFLLVDSLNLNAQNLYKKNGFKAIFEDKDATCVAVGPYGLRTQECVNICYKKSLKKDNNKQGIIGNLFSTFFGK